MTVERGGVSGQTPACGRSGNTESKPKYVIKSWGGCRLLPQQVRVSLRQAQGKGAEPGQETKQGCGTRTRQEQANGAGPEQVMQGAEPEKQTHAGCGTRETAGVRGGTDRARVRNPDKQSKGAEPGQGKIKATVQDPIKTCRVRARETRQQGCEAVQNPEQRRQPVSLEAEWEGHGCRYRRQGAKIPENRKRSFGNFGFTAAPGFGETPFI